MQLFRDIVQLYATVKKLLAYYLVILVIMSNKKPVPVYRRILIDVLGVLMLLAVPLVAWIPGPGGLPLLFGGLGLLAINHSWAKRLLEQIKTKGTDLYQLVFPQNKKAYIFYDVLGAMIVVAAISLLYQTTRNLFDSIAIAAGFFGLTLLLANRRRIEKLTAFVKRRILRKT